MYKINRYKTMGEIHDNIKNMACSMNKIIFKNVFRHISFATNMVNSENLT